MKALSEDLKTPESATTPFFSFPQLKTANTGVVQRTPGDDWVKDRDGSLYYKTQAEAENRKRILEKEGKWTEYKVESFEQGSDTYWRVLMRGPRSSGEKNLPEADEPDKNKPPESPAQEAPAEGESEPVTDPVFALTFDDGPHASTLGKGTNRTEKVLDVLKAEGIKGAFFIQTAAQDSEGNAMRGSTTTGKKLVKRMADEGHVIGIHTGGTIDHEVHTKAQAKGTLEGELESAKGYVKDVTGSDPFYVRPPKGVYNAEVGKTYARVGLTNLMWDIDGDQGANLGLPVLKRRLDAGLSDAKTHGWKPWGQTISTKIVILYHDIQKGTADNLHTLIAYIKAKVKALTGDKQNARFDKP